jgi:hypothetical protein
MPVRKRGTSWQADIVAPTGQRIRKSFPTKHQAVDFHKQNQPPKASRGAAPPSPQPSASSSPMRRRITTGQRQEPLSVPVEPRTQTVLVHSTLQAHANGGRVSLQARACPTTPISDAASSSSEHPSAAGKVSRTSRVQPLVKSPSARPSSKPPSVKRILGQRSSSSSVVTALCEAVQPSS